MPLDVRHTYVSPVPSNGDPALVQGPDWNARHTLLQGPATLLGRADSAPGQAPTVEVTLDPATLGFVGGRLSVVAATPVTTTISVPTLASLKALLTRPEAVIVESGQAAGTWAWFLADATAANDGTIVSPTSGVAGRYRRLFDGSVYLKWFGADPTATTDCTTALVAAIAAAKVHLVNSVNCSGGQWRIETGNITLANIALYAEVPPDFGGVYGTKGATFRLTSTTMTPFVLSTAWSMKGITFYYPAQDGTAVSPVVFPPLFTGDYVGGVAMEDVHVLNAYQVFKFTGYNAVGDFRMSRCRMYGIDKVFWFEKGCPEVFQIDECMFSCGVFVPAVSPNTYLRAYTETNGEFMRVDVDKATSTSTSFSGTTMTVGGVVTGAFAVGQWVYGSGVVTKITAFGTGVGGAGTYTVSTNYAAPVGPIAIHAGGYFSLDGFDMSNSIVYGYRYGHRLITGGFSVSNISDNWYDGTLTALSVEGNSWVAGTRYDNNYMWSAANTNTATMANTINITTSAQLTDFYITNCDFVYTRMNHIRIATSLSTRGIFIHNNRFANWGHDVVSAPTTYSAVNIVEAVADGSINGNKFRPSSGVVAHQRVGIGISCLDMQVTNNEFDNCFAALNLGVMVGGAKLYIGGNTSRNTGHSNAVINPNPAGVLEVVGSNAWDKLPSGPSGWTRFVLKGGTQTFTGAKTQVVFSSETLDTNQEVASDTFTCSTAGTYDFEAQLANTTGVTAADVWGLMLEKTGSVTEAINTSVYVPANVAGAATIRTQARFTLAVGDLVKAHVTRISGAGSYVVLNDQSYNRFSGGRVVVA